MSIFARYDVSEHSLKIWQQPENQNFLITPRKLSNLQDSLNSSTYAFIYFAFKLYTTLILLGHPTPANEKCLSI